MRKFFWMVVIMLVLVVGLIGCQERRIKELDEGQRQEKAEQLATPEEEKRIVPKDLVITEVPGYTYAKMEEQIRWLKEYDEIEVTTVGESVMGRKLYLLKLGSGEIKINVVGGVHGREGITSLLVLKLLEDYARHYALGQTIGSYELGNLLKRVQLYFLPMLNPDGVEIAVNGIEAFGRREFYLAANDGSEDFSRWKANANGVDLNKQFKADWQMENTVGKPYFEDYKGTVPEGEPESKALADLTRSENFASVVVFHNSGSIIFWYYKQNGKQYERDLHLAERLKGITGYELILPEQSDLRAGGYKDWFIDEFKRPGFTIEIGTGKSEEPLPSAQLDKYFAENRVVLLELALALTG